MAFQVPDLPYDYNALEPYIDEETMHLHHDKHHAAYVNNLNAAIEKHPELASKSAEDLLHDLNSVPDFLGFRNDGQRQGQQAPHGGNPGVRGPDDRPSDLQRRHPHSPLARGLLPPHGVHR